MSQPPLNPELARAAMRALQQHGTITLAAQALKMPRATLHSRIRTGENLGITLEPVEPREPLSLSFEDSWAQWMKAVGMAKDRYKGPPKARKTGSRLRVTAAGDFHVPFHDKDAVCELIAKEADTTDVLVIGGDFGDMHSASTFTKYEHIPFRDELAETTACIQLLSESFQKIVYLRGSNHMDRVEKRLRESLNQDMLDAVLSMTGGELSPDLALVKRYPNIQIGDWTTPQGHRVGWFTLLGDVAFSHAERYSRVPGSTLRSVDEWFDDFGGALGLPSVRALCQFHTHAMALLPWRSDRVLIEPGCMCTTHSYQLRSKIAGRPQRLGYVRMDIDEGRVDFDSIRLRWLNRGAESAA